VGSVDDQAGEEVLQVAVLAAGDVFGERLQAAFALGSLAHGGFAPLASDVDIALILNELTEEVPAEIDRVRQHSIARAGTPLVERLSIFWTDWQGVHHGPTGPGRLPAIDRLDLLDDGRLLCGRDQRAGASRPGIDTLIVEVAQFACARFDDAYLARLHHPHRLVAEGTRTTTKAVLFPVRFLYTLATGRIGHNARAAAWYQGQGAHPGLAEAVIRWREHGLTDPAAATTLLEAHLISVYVEFFDAYVAALAAAGRTTTAEDLLIRRRGLSAE
jgi:hypothetical protein